MKKFTHKVAYIAGGIIIGIVFSTTTGAFADQVKSLVGKKVTGEYTIVVDGTKLSDKGAVIDSRANVPARALSEALGADVKVEGRTINITSGTDSVSTEDSIDAIETEPVSDNKYMGGTKKSLEILRESKINNILTPLKKEREKIASTLEKLNSAGDTAAALLAEKRLAEYDEDLAKHEADLALIEVALEASE